MAVTKREMLLKALRREGVETVPVDFDFCPSQVDAFEKRFGHRDYHGFFDLFHRNEFIRLEPGFSDGRALYTKEVLPEDTVIDSWGVGHSKGSEAAMHMTRMHHPLKGIDCTVEKITAYPMPSIPAGEPERLRAIATDLHERGLAASASMQMTIWEQAWYLRSMEDLMADMMGEEDEATVLFDRVTENSCARARMAAEAGFDIIQLGDDIGMQQSIMMSVELWQEWIQPRLIRVIQAAREVKPDVLIFYHSCGYILPFLEGLADAGVDILNPIQPECMEFKELHDRIGHRMSFWGTIGTQKVLPFGTPEEVRAVVRKNLEICGEKGGIVIAPTHIVEPEVPWENLQVLFGAARGE
jgi:uroporphyrinogen decarboxylase